MRFSFRTGYANLLTSAGHLVLLLVALRLDQPEGWFVCLALIAIIAFFAWASTLKRNRAIADTPTSRIGSAAQGYVELYGRALSAPEYMASAKLSMPPCIWYRYVTYRRSSDNKWVEIARGTSDSLFAIEDGSGRCLIDPDHAEVLSTHHRTWYEGDYKHEETLLRPSDHIYALGEFQTLGGASAVLNLNEDVALLLAEWKKNKPELLARFDLDKSGEIDVKEWELARRAAVREVEKHHRELRAQPGVHVMRVPAGGQVYLLSNLSPQQLKSRYVWWGWFHLLTFFAATAAAVSFAL